MALPYTVEPLAPGLAYGATVLGLRHEHLASEDLCQALRDLWIDKGVILFRAGDSSRQPLVTRIISYGFGTRWRAAAYSPTTRPTCPA